MPRKSQFRMDSVGLLLACVLIAVAFFNSKAHPGFAGAVQGVVPALAVVLLRLMIELMLGWRRSFWLMSNTVVAVAVISVALWQWPPAGVWEFCIIAGLFSASLIGLFRFRFTSFFMLLCCGPAGALLL